MIVTDGGFLWRDKAFRSLSVIAHKITGTQWSGPVFFGLKKSKPKQASKLFVDVMSQGVGVPAPEQVTYD